MFSRVLFVFTCAVFFFCLIQVPFAQEPDKERGVIFEEKIDAKFITELQEEKAQPQFVIADVLTTEDVKQAIIYYIRDDINRKFSGLITNLNLEKIYGVTQEQNTATVYFDYRYTSVRNKDNILYEKGKMTFIKFNSGKWFNAELSIYLMDAYPFPLNPVEKVKEE